MEGLACPVGERHSPWMLFSLFCGRCYGLNCFLQKRHVEVLNPSTLLADRVFTEVIGLKRGHQGMPYLCDLCSYKNGYLGHLGGPDS